jgi:hypothetical protein
MMRKKQMTLKKITVVIMVFTALVLMTACGGTKVVRGAAPIVRMNELSHAGNTISLHLSMRNINGVELNIQSIDFSLSVEDDELFTYQGPAETNITANGIETWTVEVEESPSSKQLLDKLQAGEIKSLPYSLEGSVTAVDEGKLRFSNEGHIYPVPGRPGHFR